MERGWAHAVCNGARPCALKSSWHGSTNIQDRCSCLWAKQMMSATIASWQWKGLAQSVLYVRRAVGAHAGKLPENREQFQLSSPLALDVWTRMRRDDRSRRAYGGAKIRGASCSYAISSKASAGPCGRRARALPLSACASRLLMSTVQLRAGLALADAPRKRRRCLPHEGSISSSQRRYLARLVAPGFSGYCWRIPAPTAAFLWFICGY